MSRSLRLAGYIAIGIAAGLLVAATVIFLLTRTDWGMERARRFAVSWLAERVDGELRIGRVSGPGLLGGVMIHEFHIIDPKGRPFLSADSVEVSYNLRTLLRGQIVLNRAVLFSPRAVLEKLPGDTAWNYQYVFPDRTPGDDTPRARSLIMFNDARIIDGTVTVRTPLDLGDVIEPADTARILFDRFPGGLARAMLFEDINARLDRVIWESPVEDGKLIEVRSIQTRGYYYRDPFTVRDARGTVATRDTVISFDMPRVELPGSQAAVLGRVIMQEGRNDFDVRIEGSRFVFRDLQWLHPQLPEEGGGSAVLRIQTQPVGTLFLAEDARISAPGTRVAGTFGVIAGDTLFFTQVDLRASPLDVQFIEQILPGGLPIDGLLIGTVEVRGPLSALETSGDLRLAGDVVGAGSEVTWRGVFDVRDRAIRARSLDADLRQLELALVSTFAPQLRVGGNVSGRVSASTTGRNALAFSALLEHASVDGGRSVFDAGGRLDGGGGRSRRLELDVTASPVTFADLAQQVPALQGLQGELSGPVHIEGALDDLGFSAELATPGGPLLMRGRMQGRGAVRRIVADAEARGFLLHAFRTGLPPTVASGTLSVDLVGASFSDMRGPVRLALDSTRFGELPHSTLSVEASLDSGLLVVDSAVLRGSLGTGRARGTLGLLPGRAGRLDAGFSSETLAALEPFLYRSGPAADGEARVNGRLDAVATLTGWIRDLTVAADARADDLLLGPVSARRLRADLSGAGVGSTASRFRLAVTGDSLVVAEHGLDTALLDATWAGDSLALALEGNSAGQSTIGLRATVYEYASDSRSAFDSAARQAAPAGAAIAAGHAPQPEQGPANRQLYRHALLLRDLRLGTSSPWRLTGPARLDFARGIAHLDSLVLGREGNARITAAGRLAWGESGDRLAREEPGAERLARGASAAGRLPGGLPAADPVILNRPSGSRASAEDRPPGAPSTPAAPPSSATPLEFSIRMADVPFEDLLRVRRSRVVGSGTVDGMLRASGYPIDPFIEIDVAARDIVYGDVRLDHAFAEASYAGLGLDAHAEAQHGGRSILSGGGRVPLDLRLVPVEERRLAQPMRLTFVADSLPASLPLNMVDGFTSIGGRIDGMMLVQGTTLDPSLSGGFTVRNGSADWYASGVRYRDVSGSFTLERDRILTVSLDAASSDPRGRGRTSGSGSGTGTITGTLDFGELTNPEFDLRLHADGAYAARRRDVEAQVTGDIRLRGRYHRPEISGSLRIDEGALYIEELYRQVLIAGIELDDPNLLSLVDTSLVAVRPIIAASKNPFMKNLIIRDLQVHAATNSWLRSRDMDVEVSGRLNVAFDRGQEDLRLAGSLNVERGTYTLYYPPLQSRRFQVRSGSIDFLGTPGIDPNLAITAAYKARTAQGEPLDILAVVSGTLQGPRVRLSSDIQPPISESDLASYLFFGVPTWQDPNSGQQNRGVMAGLGAAALTPSVLGYASSGLQTLVQSAGILDYVGFSTAEGGAATGQSSAGFGNIFEGTQLEVGRYLRPDLFMGMTTRLGTTNIDFGDRIGARVEWRFLPQYSFELFAEDRLARTPALGARQEFGLRKVYGFFLFREWGF